MDADLTLEKVITRADISVTSDTSQGTQQEDITHAKKEPLTGPSCQFNSLMSVVGTLLHGACMSDEEIYEPTDVLTGTPSY